MFEKLKFYYRINDNLLHKSTYRGWHISLVCWSPLVHPLHRLQLVPRKIIVKINFTFIELWFKLHNNHRKYTNNVTHWPSGTCSRYRSSKLNGHETNDWMSKLKMMLTLMLVIQFKFSVIRTHFYYNPFYFTTTLVDARWQNDLIDRFYRMNASEWRLIFLHSDVGCYRQIIVSRTDTIRETHIQMY